MSGRGLKKSAKKSAPKVSVRRESKGEMLAKLSKKKKPAGSLEKKKWAVVIRKLEYDPFDTSFVSIVRVFDEKEEAQKLQAATCCMKGMTAVVEQFSLAELKSMKLEDL